MKENIRQILTSKIFYLLVLLSGLYGMLSAFLNQYQLPGATHILLLSLLAAALFTSISFLPQKSRKWVWIAVFVLWTFLGIRFYQQIAWGLYRCWEYLIPTLVQHFPVAVLDYPPLRMSEYDIVMYSFLYLLLPYLALLSWVVTNWKSAWLSLLLTIPIVAFSWNIYTAIPVHSLAFCVLFWTAMVLQSGILRKFRSKSPVPLGAVFACACVIAILVSAVSPQSYIPWEGAPVLRGQIDRAVSNIRWDTDLFQGSPMLPGGGSLANSSGEVNLNHAWYSGNSSRDVLRVYSETPSTLYLRAYSASVYTGNRWLQPDSDQYPSEGFGFEPLTFLSNQILEDSDSSEVIIEPLIGNSNFLFTPYLITGMEAEPAPRWERDAYLSGDGQQSYSFQTLAPSTDRYLISGSHTTLWYPSFTPRNATLYRIPYGEEDYDFTVISGYGPWYDGNPNQTVMSILDFFYNPTEEVDTFSLFYSDSEPDWEYMRYIMEEYTQLPDGLKETMLQWWRSVSPSAQESETLDWERIYGTSGGIVPYWKWAYAASLVAQEAREAGTYTTTPDPQPYNRDFVEYFLTEGKEGDCVYFASAATVMLRALGIPARYVEGYVVGESLFGADGWATVPSQNAHAWAEIWVPGTGWVPVEATPGGASAAPLEEDSSSNAPEETQEPLPTETPEVSLTPTPTPIESPDLESPEPSSSVSSPEAPSAEDEAEPFVLSPIVIYIFLAVCLLASPFLIRLLAVYRRKKRFGQPNPNQAALALYSDMVKLTGYSGLKISEDIYELALKAQFSNHEISASERSELEAEYQRLRMETKSRLSLRKKILFWLNGF